MKRSRAITVAVVCILAILLVSIALVPRRRNHALIAYYPSSVPGHDPDDNNEQFLADLDLIKELGFDGARLHPKDYDYYGHGKIADDLEDRGLKFVMVVEFDVTDNQTLVNEYITYYRHVAQQLVDKTNLLWYAVQYPYDWNKTSDQMDDPKWRNQTQTMINEIHETDPNHRIFLVSNSIEAEADPLKDFENVDGFGIMPYTRTLEEWVDKLDIDRINWIDRYEDTGKPVYIAEWGVQTIEGSPNRIEDYGLASNEVTKVRLIREFLDCIYDWDIYWTYFGLHDLPPEHSDWGIAYSNNSLKPSGEAIKELLTNQP